MSPAHDSSSNESFRESFRQTVPPGYSGIRHGAIVLVFGLVVLAACAAALRSPILWWEWAMAIPVLLLWNLGEWQGHRYLHRPGTTALSKALYTRHTLTHHRFFTHQDACLRDSRDLAIVFFPTFALPVITLLAAVPAALVWLALSLNAGLIVLMTVVSLYLLFEIMHLGAHLPEGNWFSRLPLVAMMRRHHQAHHDPRLMMSKNMNFTLPWADQVIGTCERGDGARTRSFDRDSTRRT